VNENEIWPVENARAPGAHAISHRRRKNGMFNREGFECDPTDFRWRPLFDYVAIFDWVML
jgi:hypothetical protein